MRRTLFTAVAAVITALTAAGCAQHAASPATPTTTAAAPNESAAASNGTTPPSPTPPGATGTPAAAKAACAATAPVTARTLTITTADNGKTLCLRTGTAVTVLLRGAPGDQWTPIHSSSAALVPRTDPRLMLQRGVAGAAFEAARPGVTTITSARHACRFPVPVNASPAAAAPADPGSTTSATTAPLHCGAIIAFKVTVAVS
jgi:hypothetical protein